MSSPFRGSRAGLEQVLSHSTAKHGEHMSACAMAQADVASSGPLCTLDVHRGGPAAQSGHWDFCFETPRCGDTGHRRNCQMEVESVCCTCVPHPWTTGRRACPQALCKTAGAGGEPEWQAVLSPGLCAWLSLLSAGHGVWCQMGKSSSFEGPQAADMDASHHISQLGHHPGEEGQPQEHVRQEALLLQACAHLLGRTLGNMWEY